MNIAKPFAKVVAVAVSVALLLSIVPMTAFASMSYDSAVSGGYYTLISKNEYALAPGATETEMILNNTDGSRRQIVHVFEVDPKNERIQVLPGYYGIDKLNPDDLSDSTNWTDMQLTKTVAYYENTLGYNVVGAMNTALAYDSNAPYGFMVYEGVQLGSPDVHKGAQTYLAIDWDGNCELRSMATPLNGTERTAIPANFNWLVKDGALVTKTPERTTAAASRSMIGIKADGSLVFCQVDGRITPLAVGLSNYEMGEMMLALGCVNAVNCDGGGSSTFISKREGESEGTMRSIPSDGSERPTINSVIIVSNAVATGIFDHAVLDTEYDYYAAGAAATVTSAGVDTNGYPVEVPTEGISWSLSDDSFGTIVDGKFTSNGKLGDVTLQMVYGGNVVGEKTIHVVNPDNFAFTVSDTVIPFGKSINVEFACTYGADDWTVGMDGACDLTLSDATAATLNGMELTATTDESKTGVVLTATYKANPATKAIMNVTFGKGSEIIYDFENGELNGFVGFDEAKQWSIDNGVNNTLVGIDPLAGQFSPNVDGYTWVASRENGGQVRNGDYALAWTLDNTTADFAGWTYNVLFNTGDTKTFRDVANGKNAVKLGMWLYIPEGAAGLAFQSQFYTQVATGYSCKQAHFTFTTANGTVKNLNSCTEADIPESRWVYASVSIADADTYYSSIPTDTTNSRSPSFIRTYVKPNSPQKITFYIDDITLDYSSAVDDRVLPTISNVTYATADTAVDLTDGAALSSNTVAFSANISDNMALNYDTATISVDGKALDNVTASGKTLSSENITLANGEHVVVFEVQDTLGNLARAERRFTIGTDAAIGLSGRNDSGAPAEVDSLYYIDVTAANMASIEKLTTVLKLQTANTWELDAVEVAPGFEATLDYNENSGLLYVTVEKTGTTLAAYARGAQTLVSIPVRVWSWKGVDHVTGKDIPADEQYATGYCPFVTIECEAVEGSVTYADNTAATFSGSVSEATNINDIAAPWHTHDAQPIADLDATCTTAGYTGRTYCDACGSIVEAGTILPATGHDYDVVDREFVCHCGEVAMVNGLIEFEGNTYYAINGKLSIGWVFEGDEYYFFGDDGAALKGTHTVNNHEYTFNDEGVLVEGSWYQSSTGMRYYWAGTYVKRCFYDIDGETYYFDFFGNMVTGLNRIERYSNSPDADFYLFSETGVLLDEDGFHTVAGDIYYVKDRMPVAAGLVQDDEGNYYYFNSTLKAVKDCSYYVYNTNNLLPQDTYDFDAEGKMIVETVDETKNGIFEEDGSLYLYIDGVKQQGLGLIEYEGAYYYVRTAGQLATGRYYISNGNGILEANQTYEFGADGKLLMDITGEVKNGVVDENGTLYLYIDGQRQKGLGLIWYEGAYYYVRTEGQLAVGTYYVYYGNGLVEDFTYHDFAADGKMIDFPADVVYTVETVNTAALKAGDEVTVDVYVTATELSLIEYKLGYDSTKLEVASVELSDTFKTFDQNSANIDPIQHETDDETVGEVWFNAMALDPIVIGDNVRIATITFKAITDVNESVDVYAVCDPLACDGNYDTLTTLAVNGGIAI